jgi:hypothetical protein
LVELRAEALRHPPQQLSTNRFQGLDMPEQWPLGISSGIDRDPPRVGGKEFGLDALVDYRLNDGFVYGRVRCR